MLPAATQSGASAAEGRKRSSLAAQLRRFLADWGPALPVIGLGLVLLVLPCLVILRQSFAGASGHGFTLASWQSVFRSRAAMQAIGDSLLLGVTVASIALLVGAPLGWVLSRLTRRWRALNLGLLTVANNFSGIGLAFGYVAALGSYGMVTLALKGLGLDIAPPGPTSFAGLVLAYEYSIVPMFVLLTLPSMSLLRDEWWEACQCCGATRMQFWRHVGLPMLSPFLGAGWILCFTWAVGLYGLPVSLMGSGRPEFNLITLEMSRTLLGSLFGNQKMPVLAVILMAFAGLSLALYRLLLRKGTKCL